MEIKSQTRNLELNAQAETYVQQKFQNLNCHRRAISDAKLELSRTSVRSQSDRVLAQMTIVASDRTLRVQESRINLFAPIDAVTDIIDRQTQRIKGKVYKSAQSKRSVRTSLALEGCPQAQQEMEFLSHNFFLFYNIDANEYNVLYHRHDGDYRVIQRKPAQDRFKTPTWEMYPQKGNSLNGRVGRKHPPFETGRCLRPRAREDGESR